jgi:hypothetical protein
LAKIQKLAKRLESFFQIIKFQLHS